jgi:hypothetical protein
MELSEAGLLSGIPGAGDQITDLAFRVTDDHGMMDQKSFSLLQGLIFILLFMPAAMTGLISGKL